MDKFLKYVPLIILIGLGICIWLLLDNKKNNSSQNDLMMAMAGKLNEKESNKNSQEKKPEQKVKQLEYNEELTYKIADKIYLKQTLTTEEELYNEIFNSQVNEQIEFAAIYYPLVNKFLKGEKEFTEDEKQFYEDNKDLIDLAVLNKFKVPGSQSKEIQTENTDLSKATPPLTSDDRLRLIRSFFDDGIPKTIPELSKMYSSAQGKNPSNSNYQLFERMENADPPRLVCIKIKSKNYYVLPEWMDGKKLKEEFKNKIA